MKTDYIYSYVTTLCGINTYSIIHQLQNTWEFFQKLVINAPPLHFLLEESGTTNRLAVDGPRLAGARSRLRPRRENGAHARA